MYLVPESHTLGREAQCMLRVFYDFKRHWGKRVARNITQGSKLKMEYEGFTIFTEAYILLLNSGQAGNGDGLLIFIYLPHENSSLNLSIFFINWIRVFEMGLGLYRAYIGLP